MGYNEGKNGPHGNYDSWMRDRTTHLGEGCRPKKSTMFVILLVAGGVLAGLGAGVVSLIQVIA